MHLYASGRHLEQRDHVAAVFCQQVGCPTYDVAVTQCPFPFDGSSNRLVLSNYTACNLVAVERVGGLDLSVYVYDATTHEMVGASYVTDVDRFTCGPGRVFGLQAGVFPSSNCGIMSTQLCIGDGGSGDAGTD